MRVVNVQFCCSTERGNKWERDSTVFVSVSMENFEGVFRQTEKLIMFQFKLKKKKKKKKKGVLSLRVCLEVACHFLTFVERKLKQKEMCIPMLLLISHYYYYYY